MPIIKKAQPTPPPKSDKDEEKGELLYNID